jgi:hypothetical protein
MDQYARIIADARRVVAHGTALDAAAFERRIRAVGGDGDGEEAALAQLGRIAAVQRARARLAGPPAPVARAAAPRRPILGTRPTISGSLDVRRDGEFALAWDADRDVHSWEVRIAERPDIRRDYREQETKQVSEPRIELPLGDLPMRVTIVGRSRGGRLVRRAVLAGVTRATWADRWQKR